MTELTIGTASLGQGALALQADIRADTNRDGRVDIQGTTDVEDKQTWTNSRGAIFLTNIFEPSDRCPTATEGYPGASILATLEQAGVCYANNATDDVQKSPEHMARILTVPIPDASDAATGVVSVSNDAARDRVRIFRATGDDWEIVKPDTVFRAEELKSGLSLGIDARDTRRPGAWDGRATVTFTVTDGEKKSEDSVMLRVAPLLTHHHLQQVEEVYATEVLDPKAKAVISAIESICAEEGIKTPLPRIATKDGWTQDIFETLYMSMPGPEGKAITKKFAFDVAKIRDGYGAASGPVWEFFRSRGVAIAHHHWPSRKFGDATKGTLESLGNLETIPPYEHNGKKFPVGRIIAGGTAGNSAKMPRHVDFFAAQESQDPLILDSDWLHVKHVDEFVQFLPADTKRGWRLMVNDALSGINLLKDIQAKNGGQERLANHPDVMRKRTVDQFLENEVHHWAAGNVSERIQGVIDVLKDQTGITDEEILRVPVLYSPLSSMYGEIIPNKMNWKRASIGRRQEQYDRLPTPWEAANSDLPSEEAAGEQATAQDGQSEKRQGSYIVKKPVFPVDSYLANAINGLPVTNSLYISPKPFGPVFNGQDVFEEAIRAVYTQAGFKVRFVDDWAFHSSSGDIHCATNTRREITDTWW